MSEVEKVAEARPARGNPPPPVRRAFTHRKVTVDGKNFEIHPGPSFNSEVRVYERTTRGLKRVKVRGAVKYIVDEFHRQHDQATKITQEVVRAEATRKPPVMRKPSLRWRFGRWLALRWAALRARLTDLRSEAARRGVS